MYVLRGQLRKWQIWATMRLPGIDDNFLMFLESPASSEGRPRQRKIKIVSRSASQDPGSLQMKPTPEQQPPPQENVAYCDF